MDQNLNGDWMHLKALGGFIKDVGFPAVAEL